MGTALGERASGPIQCVGLMSRHRRNPQALSDPKLSVVIPIYNEKNTLEELLRRVTDDPMRKEILLVDDFSTDGTRQMLEKMQQLQAAGEPASLVPGNGLPRRPGTCCARRPTATSTGARPGYRGAMPTSTAPWRCLLPRRARDFGRTISGRAGASRRPESSPGRFRRAGPAH